jgi:four helix bundle protein
MAEGEVPQRLSYERLDVYRIAIEYVAFMAPVLEGLPRGNAGLADQLKRASLSVPLNIAEAAGKISAADRSRYYATARGSAMECGAILDVCAALRAVDDERSRAAKALIVRLVAMLTKLCR